MERWAPGTAVYNTPLTVDLDGPLERFLPRGARRRPRRTGAPP